jgi:glucokinase
MADPWVLGIEIGGTKLQLGIGDGIGSLAGLERLRVEPSSGAAGILDQIKTAYPALLKGLNLATEQIDAIGIGFGGPVDAGNGRTQKSYQISGWNDFPLTSWVSAHLGVALVVLENDADAAGLAESRFGAGLGNSPLLYLTVGSGIGGALIVNGQIYRGCGQGATEVGHLRVPDVSPAGTRMLELEQVASGWAITSAAQETAQRLLREGHGDWVVLAKAGGRPSEITAAMVAEAASARDSQSTAILDRARRAISFALSQAITLLGPGRIVIGGGVSLVGEGGWFEPIRRLVEGEVFEPFRGCADIVPAALGEEVVVHGALAVARDAILTRAGAARSRSASPG